MGFENNTLLWIGIACAVLGGLGIGGLVLRNSIVGRRSFKARPARRIDVVEETNVDGRRRLILIRRDGIEHLIMTGGPTDMVIESGIGQHTPHPDYRLESGFPPISGGV